MSIFIFRNQHRTNATRLLNRVLNVIFCVLILFEFYKTLIFINHRTEYATDFYAEGDKGKYNLFILIMDGYANSNNLKKYWNYDNKFFTNLLKDKGFFIVEQSKSNYIYSEQTLCSLLSLDYIDKSKNNLHKTYQMLHNPLYSSAYKMGYNCYNLGLFPIDNVETKYSMESFTIKNFYHYLALESPLLAYFNYFNKIAAQNRVKSDLAIFKELDYLFKKKGENKLVLSHSMITHYPYDKIDSISFHNTFSSNICNDDSTGINWYQYNSQKIPKGENSKFCKECYLNQIKIMNCLMSQTLNNSWSDISDNSVVIILSDHGYRFLENNLNPSNQEAYENFMAIYYPDKDYFALNDTMTIVNAVRMCVNKALNKNFPYIKDKSYLK